MPASPLLVLAHASIPAPRSLRVALALRTAFAHTSSALVRVATAVHDRVGASAGPALLFNRRRRDPSPSHQRADAAAGVRDAAVVPPRGRRRRVTLCHLHLFRGEQTYFSCSVSMLSVSPAELTLSCGFLSCVYRTVGWPAGGGSAQRALLRAVSRRHRCQQQPALR